jgi:hypothetical protein
LEEYSHTPHDFAYADNVHKLLINFWLTLILTSLRGGMWIPITLPISLAHLLL